MGLRIAGIAVPDPMPIWYEYVRERPRTLRRYDLGERGAPDHLTAEEAWRSRIVNSRLTRSECEDLVGRGAEPGCPWGDVPESADLFEADPGNRGSLFTKATRLYWYFTTPRIPGIGVAKIHKVLHIKRPALYPILGRRVKRLYSQAANPWVAELYNLQVTIADSPPYWAAIRQDLIFNNKQLSAYRKQLTASGDETVTLLGKLTNLRMQDIVAWHLAGGA